MHVARMGLEERCIQCFAGGNPKYRDHLEVEWDIG